MRMEKAKKRIRRVCACVYRLYIYKYGDIVVYRCIYTTDVYTPHTESKNK